MLAQLGTPQELLESPASPFVKDFLGGRAMRRDRDGKIVGYTIDHRFDSVDRDDERAPTSRRVPDARRAPFWSGGQLEGNWDVIWYYTLQHARYTMLAVGLGAAFALPLSYWAVRQPRVYPVLLSGTNVIYAIPSLAMFVMLRPLGRLDDKPIVVAMALYTLVILVRNIVESVRSVPPSVVRAAEAMGYRPLRRFGAVELPLALPGIIAGLRLATVSTVSLISVGGVIGRGALGRMFKDGFDRQIVVELWSAMIAVVTLALAFDAAIYFGGRLLTPWTRAGRSTA